MHDITELCKKEPLPDSKPGGHRCCVMLKWPLVSPAAQKKNKIFRKQKLEHDAKRQQQSKKTLLLPHRTQRSHSAKKVAGGKGYGADNAPIPMPLVSHEMRARKRLLYSF